MLRDAGVRTKLLAVLAIPTVLLVVVTGLLVGGQVTAAGRAGQVNALTDVAIQVNRVVHSLQEERSATLGYLQDAEHRRPARMIGQRQYTNQQLRTLRGLVADSPVDQMSEAVQAAVARSTAAHDELASAPAGPSTPAGSSPPRPTSSTPRSSAPTSTCPGVVASSGTTALAQRLQAYQALSSAIEYASHERDLVETALAPRHLDRGRLRARLGALVAQQRQALQTSSATPRTPYARLDNALAEVRGLRDRPGTPRPARPAQGPRPRHRPLGRVGRRRELPDRADDRLRVRRRRRHRRPWPPTPRAPRSSARCSWCVASVLGLGLALMLAVGLARRITRPLRRLTVAAGEIGDELPRMVERMQTPGEGPGVVVEPIPVESDDEIGRLAEAFNTVNDVTVQVAKEQAALRAEHRRDVRQRRPPQPGAARPPAVPAGPDGGPRGGPRRPRQPLQARPPRDPDAPQRREPAGARRHRLDPPAAQPAAAVRRDPHRGRRDRGVRPRSTCRCRRTRRSPAGTR